jgi:hypothetical protein
MRAPITASHFRQVCAARITGTDARRISVQGKVPVVVLIR